MAADRAPCGTGGLEQGVVSRIETGKMGGSQIDRSRFDIRSRPEADIGQRLSQATARSGADMDELLHLSPAGLTLFWIGAIRHHSRGARAQHERPGAAKRPVLIYSLVSGGAGTTSK